MCWTSLQASFQVEPQNISWLWSVPLLWVRYSLQEGTNTTAQRCVPHKLPFVWHCCVQLKLQAALLANIIPSWSQFFFKFWSPSSRRKLFCRPCAQHSEILPLHMIVYPPAPGWKPCATDLAHGLSTWWPCALVWSFCCETRLWWIVTTVWFQACALHLLDFYDVQIYMVQPSCGYFTSGSVTRH